MYKLNILSRKKCKLGGAWRVVCAHKKETMEKVIFQCSCHFSLHSELFDWGGLYLVINRLVMLIVGGWFWSIHLPFSSHRFNLFAFAIHKGDSPVIYPFSIHPYLSFTLKKGDSPFRRISHPSKRVNERVKRMNEGSLNTVCRVFLLNSNITTFILNN